MESGDFSQVFGTLLSKAPASLHHYFESFSRLHNQKLWHELTGQVEAFFNEPMAKPLLLPLYHQFVVPSYKKLNPQSFVWLSIQTAAQMTNPQEAISLLLALSQQFSKEKTYEAHLYVFARMSAAFYQLRGGELSEAKAGIEECAPLVDAFTGVDKSIRAVFYRVKAELDKAKALFSSYYRDALLYLACVKVEELSKDEAVSQAHDLCVSALLGDSVYNFGELLMHPILEALHGTQFEYLEQTLRAFNAGNHQQFDALMHALSSNSVFAGRLDFLRQKICLMALVELVFSTLKSGRHIPFGDVSQAARVPLEEVEFLLIKALSLGLIRGSIDGVHGRIEIEWVQPRVLDRSQLEALRQNIQTWKSQVAEIGNTFNANNYVHRTIPLIDECQ